MFDTSADNTCTLYLNITELYFQIDYTCAVTSKDGMDGLFGCIVACALHVLLYVIVVVNLVVAVVSNFINTFDGFQTSGALVLGAVIVGRYGVIVVGMNVDRRTMNGMGLSGSTASYVTVVELNGEVDCVALHTLGCMTDKDDHWDHSQSTFDGLIGLERVFAHIGMC